MDGVRQTLGSLASGGHDLYADLAMSAAPNPQHVASEVSDARAVRREPRLARRGNRLIEGTGHRSAPQRSQKVTGAHSPFVFASWRRGTDGAFLAWRDNHFRFAHIPAEGARLPFARRRQPSGRARPRHGPRSGRHRRTFRVVHFQPLAMGAGVPGPKTITASGSRAACHVSGDSISSSNDARLATGDGARQRGWRISRTHHASGLVSFSAAEDVRAVEPGGHPSSAASSKGTPLATPRRRGQFARPKRALNDTRTLRSPRVSPSSGPQARRTSRPFHNSISSS
jgi:hypothetical protein